MGLASVRTTGYFLCKLTPNSDLSCFPGFSSYYLPSCHRQYHCETRTSCWPNVSLAAIMTGQHCSYLWTNIFTYFCWWHHFLHHLCRTCSEWRDSYFFHHLPYFSTDMQWLKMLKDSHKQSECLWRVMWRKLCRLISDIFSRIQHFMQTRTFFLEFMTSVWIEMLNQRVLLYWGRGGKCLRVQWESFPAVSLLIVFTIVTWRHSVSVVRLAVKRGCKLDSLSCHCQTVALGKQQTVHAHEPFVTEWYNLVPVLKPGR